MKINNKIKEGNDKIVEFAHDLVVRNKVAEAEQGAEQEKLEQMIVTKILDEALTALPEDDIAELEAEEEVTSEKLNSRLFVAGVRPESIIGKVFREVEREYLGVENVESDETLMEAGEEE